MSAARIRVNQEEYDLIIAHRNGTESPPNSPPTTEAKPFVLSAWNFDTGLMMDIEQYCAHYKLPHKDIIDFKLVSHTGTPFFNVKFRENRIDRPDLTNDFIDSVIRKHIKPTFIPCQPDIKDQDHWFDRAIYTDTHIGMDTDKEKIAMYPTVWNRSGQLDRAYALVKAIASNRTSNVLYLDELGDFMDGWNGLTTRGGHQLPQNMSNEDAFDTGIEFKMLLIDGLVNHYDFLNVQNICNDNHAGAFGYVVNSAVKKICEIKYSGKVSITNHRQFINHYIVGKHAFVNTHGKDAKSLKFGFKPKLDPVQIEKIDGYLKNKGVYRAAEYIEFSKGDSHQMLLDYCTSDDFTYFNYHAMSPSSEWVQNNFKRGRSGFVIQNVMYNQNVKNIIPKFFKAGSHELE